MAKLFITHFRKTMQQFTKDHLIVRRYEDRSTMGIAAARSVADHIRQELGVKDYINMIFAAAPSQNEMLAALIHENIDWTRIHAFHMDEYIGLPENAPQS